MRILFDTNVVLDLLVDRQPHSKASAAAIGLADRGLVEGILCATTITMLHYLLMKATGRPAAIRRLRDIFGIFEIAPVTREILMGALHIGFADFEDAVVHEAAVAAKAQAIVTRDPRGFARGNMLVLSPGELLLQIRSTNR